MLSGGKIRKGSFRLLSLLMVQCKTLRASLLRAWEICQICERFKVSVKLEMLCAERVAERLNMSVTTLRRHLQVKGTSFQQLKDECRMKAAFHYLSCPDMSHRDIAGRLGFDEVSVFAGRHRRHCNLMISS